MRGLLVKRLEGVVRILEWVVVAKYSRSGFGRLPRVNVGCVWYDG